MFITNVRGKNLSTMIDSHSAFISFQMQDEHCRSANSKIAVLQVIKAHNELKKQSFKTCTSESRYTFASVTITVFYHVSLATFNTVLVSCFKGGLL